MIPVSVWRWAKALAGGGVAGLVPAAKRTQTHLEADPEGDRADPGAGPAGRRQGRDRRRDRGVGILGPQRAPSGPPGRGRRPRRPGPRGTSGSTDTGSADTGSAETGPAGADAGVAEPEVLPVLPDPVPRDGERALARSGLLGEGAAPAFTPGARYPLAGLLLALPPLAQSGLLACARQVYGRLRNGFYSLEVMLIVLVFMALLREARAEGATRIPPEALGAVWAWTGPRKSRRSAASSPSWRRRQGRGPAAGAGPPPRRGQPGHPGIPLHRRAHPERSSASGTSRRCTWPG